MDFGDILRMWEQNTRPPSAAMTGREPENDDAGSHLSRKQIEAMPIDATLDLHGMTRAEAEVALAGFFGTAERTGCTKVLIIHGKGLHSGNDPVLADYVRSWLERRPSAGRSGHAAPASGGNGATWVLLKRGGISARGR